MIRGHTAFKKLFDGHHNSVLLGVESFLARRLSGHDPMNHIRAGIPKVPRGDLQPVRERRRHCSAGLLLEFVHPLCEVAWDIERSHAEVDVHHELLVRRPDRHEEAAECFDAE